MAVRVVDLLEVIQIEQDQAQRLALALAALHRGREPCLVGAAVEQSGETVGLGGAQPLLQLGLFPLEQCLHAGHFSGGARLGLFELVADLAVVLGEQRRVGDLAHLGQVFGEGGERPRRRSVAEPAWASRRPADPVSSHRVSPSTTSRAAIDPSDSFPAASRALSA